MRDARQPATPQLVVATPDELRAIVRAALDDALAARSASGSVASEWLDAKAVATMLGVHPRSVQKMHARQGLPAHKVGEKLLRYRRDEVERWIRDRRSR